MSSSKLPKVALVGCGPWGANLARAFARQGVLDTIVDIVPAQANQLADLISSQSFTRPRISTWPEVLQDPEIDAVALATPAPKHAEMAIACLDAGKHVFTEKPFALSVEDGQRVAQKAIEVGNKTVMVGHLFQYHPAFVKLRDLVRQGRLGRIQHIHSRRLNFGRVREEENAFWNLGVHDVSMILALAHGSPDEVTIQGFNHLRGNIADVVTVGLIWETGLQAHIHVSWLYPQKERKLIVVGDVATAVFDDCEPWESKLRVFDNRFPWKNGVPQAIRGEWEAVSLEAQESLNAECREFIECVKSGRQAATSSDEALPVVDVLARVEAELRRSQPTKSDSKQTSDYVQTNGTANAQDHQNATLPDQNQTYGKANGKANRVQHKPTNDIPLIDLTTQRVQIQSTLNARLSRVFSHGRYILGPEVHELEARLCSFTGASHVVSCGSGTGALTLSLLALNFQPGDAIIVPDLSFVATVEPVVLLGGVPIFVDVEPTNLTLDASLINAGVAAASQAGHRAVGIIAVDLYGHAADYSAINAAAARHNLWVIADGAQSLSGAVNGQRVGSLARVTTTSFFPSKPLGGYGDGGAVFTDDQSLAATVRSLRQHGLDNTKTDGLMVGLNSRLDTIQAAVLLCKLDLLADERTQRQKAAETYSGLLRDVVAVPSSRKDVESAWAAYTVRTKQRDAVQQRLAESGIAYAIYYAVPFHKQAAYKRFPVVEGGCPVTERACKEIISLPIGPYLSAATQMRVAQTVREALDERT